mmetsp:Transcript_19534/g.59090  ORF Transcript_19534/g.59090 Transcript_19534/m.59090 type:complete len:244 (-) Transcript_19534:233-964(-)
MYVRVIPRSRAQLGHARKEHLVVQRADGPHFKPGRLFDRHHGKTRTPEPASQRRQVRRHRGNCGAALDALLSHLRESGLGYAKEDLHTALGARSDGEIEPQAKAALRDPVWVAAHRNLLRRHRCRRFQGRHAQRLLVGGSAPEALHVVRRHLLQDLRVGRTGAEVDEHVIGNGLPQLQVRQQPLHHVGAPPEQHAAHEEADEVVRAVRDEHLIIVERHRRPPPWPPGGLQRCDSLLPLPRQSG